MIHFYITRLFLISVNIYGFLNISLIFLDKVLLNYFTVKLLWYAVLLIIRLTWVFSKANLVIYKLCSIHSMAVKHETHEKCWGQVFRRIREIGIFLMNCVWCLIHRAWALWGICLTCNASQFSHGLQYYWNDPELYASHWSLVNISTDSFLLLTGHLNIALFPMTKIFSHEISNSFSL